MPPHNGLEYCNAFDYHLDSICRNTTPHAHLIIAGDLNTAIGRRDPNIDLSNTTSKCIGPYRINPPGRICPREEPYISLMLTYNLRHITSFFSHCIYSTHYNNLTKQHRQLDYFLVIPPISLFIRIKDAYTCKALVPTVHRAVTIKISLHRTSKKKKQEENHYKSKQAP